MSQNIKLNNIIVIRSKNCFLVWRLYTHEIFIEYLQLLQMKDHHPMHDIHVDNTLLVYRNTVSLTCTSRPDRHVLTAEVRTFCS